MASADSYQLSRASLCEFPTQSVRWQVSPGKSAIFPSTYPPHVLSTDFGSKDFVLRRRLVHLSLASLEVRVRDHAEVAGFVCRLLQLGQKGTCYA